MKKKDLGTSALVTHIAALMREKGYEVKAKGAGSTSMRWGRLKIDITYSQEDPPGPIRGRQYQVVLRDGSKVLARDEFKVDQLPTGGIKRRAEWLTNKVILMVRQFERLSKESREGESMPTTQSLIREALDELAWLLDEDRWGDLETYAPGEKKKLRMKLAKGKEPAELKPVGRFKGLEMGAGKKATKKEPEAALRFATLDYHDMSAKQKKALAAHVKKVFGGKKPKKKVQWTPALLKVRKSIVVRKHETDDSLKTLKIRGTSAKAKKDLQAVLQLMGAPKDTPIITGGTKTMAFVPAAWVSLVFEG